MFKSWSEMRREADEGWLDAHIPSQTLKHTNTWSTSKGRGCAQNKLVWTKQQCLSCSEQARSKVKSGVKSQPSQRGASHNNYSNGDNDTDFKTVTPRRHSLFHSVAHVNRNSCVRSEEKKSLRENCAKQVWMLECWFLEGFRLLLATKTHTELI